jgi:hypothetical protein
MDIVELPEKTTRPGFGERVDGIDIPVFNERIVRASAGLLFLVGIVALMIAALTGNVMVLQGFAFIFMIDMMFRLFVSTRFTPSMLLGALMVYRQRPEWVGAEQKRLAWSLGLGLSFVSCVAMGYFGIDPTATLLLCGLCVGVLFLETAFGICVGCSLYRVFAKEKPRLCPGDVCTYVRPTRVKNR